MNESIRLWVTRRRTSLRPRVMPSPPLKSVPTSGGQYGLPDLSLPSSQKQAATGTDGKAVDVDQITSKQLTHQLTPELTRRAFLERNRLAADSDSGGNSGLRAVNCKRLQGGKLGNENNGLSPHVTEEEQLRPAGLEPATSGLGKQFVDFINPGLFASYVKTKIYGVSHAQHALHAPHVAAVCSIILVSKSLLDRLRLAGFSSHSGFYAFLRNLSKRLGRH